MLHGVFILDHAVARARRSGLPAAFGRSRPAGSERVTEFAGPNR